MSNHGSNKAPAAQGGRRPTGAVGAGAPAPERGRWSSRRKMEAVLRLLKGEDLDALSRELRVTGSRLTRWRNEFLGAGQVALKSREADAHDDEIRRLKTKIGEITMENELLYDKIHRLEANLPPDLRRSRR